MSLASLVSKLYEIGVIQFGEFTLKSGIKSPIYIDLRVTISYPRLLQEIAVHLFKEMKSLSYDLICGVPYTALPFATAISLHEEIPMILRRKEIKEHGTKKRLEGKFQKGQRCIIIEDIVTSGSSILETAASLQKEGLIVTDAIVLIDRQQGGEEHLEEHDIALHSCYSLTSIISILQNEKKIDPLTVQSLIEFIENTQL